jgi:hypothetical protein
MELRFSHLEEITENQRRGIEERLGALAGSHSDITDVRVVGGAGGPHRAERRSG